MYRVNKSHDESSSDDEGPSLRKEQRLDCADDAMKDCKAGSKAAQMWTDLLAEQSLAETFSDKVGVYRGENDMVERGVESYILPDVRSTSNGQEMKYQMIHELAADDSGPFDFIADEEKVEEFRDKYERYSRRYDGGSRIDRQGPISFTDQGKNTKESWKHFPSTSRSDSRESSDRIVKNVGSINNPLKRRKDDRNSSSLPSDDYALETLFTAEFPPNISIGELAERIVRALGERNEKFLRSWSLNESYYSVILEIGEEKALELFEATREIEASGGMMIADGTRRRTPGGVFITLFKTDPDVSPVLKEKVCNLQKAVAREIKTARRRGKREGSKAFDAFGKVDMLKKLSKASELLLEKQSMEENPL